MLSSGLGICMRKHATGWFFTSSPSLLILFSRFITKSKIQHSLWYSYQRLWYSEYLLIIWDPFFFIVWLWEWVEKTIKIQESHGYQSALQKQILQTEGSFSKKKNQNLGQKAKKQQSSKFMKLLHGLQGMLFSSLSLCVKQKFVSKRCYVGSLVFPS